MLLAAVIGVLIGLSLGTLGGGGSMLTVPALVYLLGQDPHGAVGSSLMIVGTNALLGAWLHQRSGASRGALSADGSIAMWLMPLLFLVALLAAGEIVVMRGMWRWATRMIAKIRDARGEATGADVTPKSTTRTTNQSKTNRKRSK